MTRKRFVWIAAIGVIAVSVVVYLYVYASQTYKLTEQYEDPEQGIAFNYPAGWVVKKDEEDNSICIADSRTAMERIEDLDLLSHQIRMCLSIEGPEYLARWKMPEFGSALAAAQGIKNDFKYDQIVENIVGPKQLEDFPYDAAQISLKGDAGEGEVEYITIIIRFDDQHTAWFGVDIRSNSTWWTQRKYKATFLAIARSIQFTNPNSAP